MENKAIYPVETDNPFLIRNNNQCIGCGRCVTIAQEKQCCQVLRFKDQQIPRKPPSYDVTLKETDCTFCGSCISVCPTKALVEKFVDQIDQTKELKKVKTTCPFCGVGCNYDLNVQDGKVLGVTANPKSVVNGELLCVKGHFGTDYIHSPYRLTKPLIRKNGELVESTWEEALDFAATRIKEITQQYGPDSFAGMSSARCTNEENYLFQKFVRCAIGTNNIDHCARTCHSPTVAGLNMAFGSGAMTNSISEIPETPVLFVIGANPTEAHPVIGAKMKQALRKGTKLIVADPRKTELAEKAHVWLQLKPGTDIALINGLMHIILANQWQDETFISEHTEDFAELREVVSQYTPDVVEAITGVSQSQLFEAAKIYGTAESAGIYYTLGITEHVFGTYNVLSLANLAMLTGNVGKPHCGVNPLRGQNNVQGSCDMGCLPEYLPGYQRVSDPAARKKFEQVWQTNLSAEEGYSIPQMFNGMLMKALRCFYIMGENPVVTDANVGHVRACLESLEFLVVQDIFLTETAQMADVVLPAASFAEKNGTFTNAERRIQRVRQAIVPIGDCKTDSEIIQELAKRFDYSMQYESEAEILAEVAQLSPLYAGVTYERIDEQGLQWPVRDAHHPGTTYLHKAGQFTRGKGKFHAIHHAPPAELPSSDFPYTLVTGRILYHYNVSTYRYSKSLTEQAFEEYVRIHPEDARREGIAEGQWLTITSLRGSVQAKAKVTEAVMQGTIWMSFHYANCLTNLVTNDAHDKITKTYEYKVCAVKIEK